VTPSARLLVRLPLQIILTVEAALPSTIAPEMSVTMQINMKLLTMRDHKPKRSVEHAQC
jgi:hypothetical protein